jgi:hypothetical protein
MGKKSAKIKYLQSLLRWTSLERNRQREMAESFGAQLTAANTRISALEGELKDAKDKADCPTPIIEHKSGDY